MMFKCGEFLRSHGKLDFDDQKNIVTTSATTKLSIRLELLQADQAGGGRLAAKPATNTNTIIPSRG